MWKSSDQENPRSTIPRPAAAPSSFGSGDPAETEKEEASLSAGSSPLVSFLASLRGFVGPSATLPFQDEQQKEAPPKASSIIPSVFDLGLRQRFEEGLLGEELLPPRGPRERRHRRRDDLPISGSGGAPKRRARSASPPSTVAKSHRRALGKKKSSGKAGQQGRPPPRIMSWPGSSQNGAGPAPLALHTAVTAATQSVAVLRLQAAWRGRLGRLRAVRIWSKIYVRGLSRRTWEAVLSERERWKVLLRLRNRRLQDLRERMGKLQTEEGGRVQQHAAAVAQAQPTPPDDDEQLEVIIDMCTVW